MCDKCQYEVALLPMNLKKAPENNQMLFQRKMKK